jgi:hypothetical protein
MNEEHLNAIVLSLRFTRTTGNSELYLRESPSAISSILYTTLRCTEGAACHRTWATGLFRLLCRVPPALVFSLAGRELGPERVSASTIRSKLSESVQ